LAFQRNSYGVGDVVRKKSPDVTRFACQRTAEFPLFDYSSAGENPNDQGSGTAGTRIRFLQLLSGKNLDQQILPRPTATCRDQLAGQMLLETLRQKFARRISS
jgi:hypothetical protein